jgi:hypothetical protein
LSLYPTIVLRRFPPPRQDIEFYIWLALLAGVTSLVAVWALARLPYFVVALVITASAGFVLAGTLGAITYGHEDELLTGLTARAIGGGIIGVIATIPAWSLQNVARCRAAMG